MRKQELWMILVASTLTIQCLGQILNGGFEDWVDEQNYQRPVHWNTNQDAGLVRFERDTLHVEGSYSLKILSEASSAWSQCASIASTHVKFSSPLDNNKALSFSARSLPESTSWEGGVYLRVSCSLYSNGSFLHEFKWKAEGAIDDFRKVTIPLYFGNIDSMIIGVFGGAQNGVTDGCHYRSVSWLDDFEIEEYNEPSSCAEIVAYDLGFPGLFFTNMIKSNDTLVVSGLIQSNDTSIQNIILMRFDTNAVLIDSFVFAGGEQPDNIHPLGEKTRGLWRSENGDYLLLNQVSYSGGVLLKVARNGQLIWRRLLKDSMAASQYFKKVIGIDGGYLLAGHKRVVNSSNHIFVMKLDIDGNILWEAKFGDEDERDHFYNGLIVNNTNEIFVSGSAREASVPGGEREYTHRLFAIDSTGGLIWHWESEPTSNELIRGVIHDNNGKWRYAAVSTDYLSSDPFFTLPKFVQLDSEFNVLTETELDDADAMHNYLYHGIGLSDGGYLGLGINYESAEPLDQVYAWMVRLDDNGQVVLERKDLAFSGTPFSGTQYLHSATELPGGNIIAAGSYYSRDDRPFGMLVKVDKCGCLPAPCTITSLTGPTEITRSQIRVYPNPAQDYLIIDAEENIRNAVFEVFDLSGRWIQSVEMHNNNNYVSLAPVCGMYIWRLVSSNGMQLGAGKVVIDR